MADRSRLWLVVRFWSVSGVESAVFVGGFIHQGWRSHGDTFAGGFEAVFGSAVLYDAHFAGVVHVAVFTFYFSSWEFGFDFEGAVGAFVAVGVRTILVMPIMEKCYLALKKVCGMRNVGGSKIETLMNPVIPIL